LLAKPLRISKIGAALCALEGIPGFHAKAEPVMVANARSNTSNTNDKQTNTTASVS
jgi:hypothetical protein